MSNRLLDLTKFVKAQEGAAIDIAQKELVELYKGYEEAFGVKPQVLIGSDAGVRDFITRHYGEPDWREPVMIQIDPDNEDSLVRVLRSVDLKGYTLNLI